MCVSRVYFTLNSMRWIVHDVGLRVVDANTIPANCPYLIGTVPIFGESKLSICPFLQLCPYFCRTHHTLLYRKNQSVPIFDKICSICPYFCCLKVGRYDITFILGISTSSLWSTCYRLIPLQFL